MKSTRRDLFRIVALTLTLAGASPSPAWTTFAARGGKQVKEAQQPGRTPNQAPNQAQANQEGQPAAKAADKVVVKIVDENGVIVPSARVMLEQVPAQTILRGESDFAGRVEFNSVAPGHRRLRVEKEGFYPTVVDDPALDAATTLEITLNHQQEITEVVNVDSTTAAIDPTRTAATQSLNGQQIINIPYSPSRDIRYVLPLMPGVLQDPSGQAHVAGASTYQTVDRLDGFNITQPTTGSLDLRFSADAVRAVDVQASRYSSEYGKGSGGIVSFATGMGDNHYRFSATDFIPSFQRRRGFNFNDWTPRVTVSGPLHKNKAWFFDAADAEYKFNIVPELPRGADHNAAWRVSNLFKAQVNLSEGNILTASLLVNDLRSEHSGLSRFNPVEATLNQMQTAYLATLRDQTYLHSGVLLEAGFGVIQFSNRERPLGDLPYLVTPATTFARLPAQAGAFRVLATPSSLASIGRDGTRSNPASIWTASSMSGCINAGLSMSSARTASYRASLTLSACRGLRGTTLKSAGSCRTAGPSLTGSCSSPASVSTVMRLSTALWHRRDSLLHTCSLEAATPRLRGALASFTTPRTSISSPVR